MIRRRCIPIALLAWLATIGGVVAADGPLSISNAWTTPAARGADIPLFLTINNAGPADVLLRTSCNTANFSEQHTVDQGEGFPSMRVVKLIPIAGNGVTRLGPDGYHVMLLQTTKTLVASESFHCSLSFRNAGKQDVEVIVGSSDRH